MNRFFFLVVAFTIITCSQKEADDKKTDIKEWHIEDGYVPDEGTAIKIAEVIWTRIYGDEIQDEKPFTAKLINKEIWIVKGTLPPEMIGGVAYAKIQKKDGKILEIYHSK